MLKLDISRQEFYKCNESSLIEQRATESFYEKTAIYYSYHGMLLNGAIKSLGEQS